MIENSIAYVANLQCKICIFTVRRQIAFIEAPEFGEEGLWQHDRSAGTVVDFACVVVNGQRCVLIAAKIPG